MAKKDKKKKEEGETPEEETAPKAAADGAAEGAAEGGEGAAEGEEGGKKKSKKKLIIIAAAAFVVLAGGGGAAFMMMKGGGHGAEEEHDPTEKPTYYDMPEMLINLSSPGKQASFLKARIILELPKALDAVQVEANLPRLMDAFNTYVRELRPSDLSGSAGITRLREELLLRANKVLEPVKVSDVLFKEIVVQ